MIYRDQSRMFPPVAVSLTVGGFYVTAAGSLIATLARDLQVPETALSFLGSAYGVGMLICGLAAPYTLRFGPVWSMRFSPILALIGTVLLLWSPSVLVSVIGAQLACFGGALISAAIPATFLGKSGTRYLALVTGVASIVSILTTVLFSVAERVFPGYGRFALLFVLIPIAAALFISWRLPALPFRQAFALRTVLPLLPSDYEASGADFSVGRGEDGTVSLSTDINSSSELNNYPAGQEKSTPVSTQKPRSLLLGTQVVRITIVAGVEFAMYAWAVTRLLQLGVSLAGASALATVFAIGMGLGRTGGARFSMRYRAWWVFVCLGMAGTVMTAYLSQVGLVTFGLFLAGLGVSCLYPIVSTDFSGIPGVKPQVASAYVSGLSGLGALVFPLILGVLLNVAGLQFGFGVLLSGYALLLILPRPRQVHH